MEGFDKLSDKIDKFESFIADKAYDAESRVLEVLKAKNIEPVIPPKKNRTSAREYDKHLYKARHLIENFFAKLKQYRAIATRYDKLSKVFLSAVHMAASFVWLN